MEVKEFLAVPTTSIRWLVCVTIRFQVVSYSVCLSLSLSLSLPSSLTPSYFRLRLLLTQLERGEIPPVEDLKKTVVFAANVLTKGQELHR